MSSGTASDPGETRTADVVGDALARERADNRRRAGQDDDTRRNFPAWGYTAALLE